MELTAAVTLNRSAAEVFDYLSEPSNNPIWQKGMRSCGWITDPPVRVGSRYRQEASFAGRSVVSVFEVTEYEPGRSISFGTIESTFPIQVRRSVDDRGDGTCDVHALIGGGPRVPKFLAPLIGRMAQRSVTRDYDRLVDLLS